MRSKAKTDPEALDREIATKLAELDELYQLRATRPHVAAEYGWVWCPCGRRSLVGTRAEAARYCDHCVQTRTTP
jgi:hypothetical protein